MNTIEIKKVNEPKELEKVFAIRKEVFVYEQNCPPELEWEYEDESNHFLAKVNGEPAGAARWRKTANGYKLERFAVLKSFVVLVLAKLWLKLFWPICLPMLITFIYMPRYKLLVCMKNLRLKN